MKLGFKHLQCRMNSFSGEKYLLVGVLFRLDIINFFLEAECERLLVLFFTNSLMQQKSDYIGTALKEEKKMTFVFKHQCLGANIYVHFVYFESFYGEPVILWLSVGHMPT